MAMKQTETGTGMAQLYWKCKKCGRTGEVNMVHSLVKDHVWKAGFQMKSMCWTCRKNVPHTIVTSREA